MNRAQKRRMKSAEKRRQHKLAMRAARRSLKQRSNASQQTLNYAMQHHSAGLLSEAESSYQQILLTDPNQPDALHLLGTIALQKGKLQVSVDLIAKAIAINPNIAEFYSNRGLALQELKQLDDAIASFEKAISIKPDYAEAYSNHGTALQELKQLDEAVTSYDKAISIKPDYVEAYFNRGVALKELRQLDEAVASYDKAIAINSNIAAFYANRGVALLDLKQLDEAVASYNKAISIKPDYAEAYFNRGIALKELKQLDEAVASYNKAISIKPDFTEAHNNLGTIIKEKGNFDDAILHYRKAISLQPDYVDAQINLSKALAENGDLEEAEIALRKVLSLSSEHAEAYRIIATLKFFTKHDEDVKSMEGIFAKNDISNEGRMHLGFGLGKAYEDLKQYDESFKMYSGGNSLERESRKYSTETERAYFERIKKTFTPSFIQSFDGGGCEGETPIFILGMPRSGTSLVEQILDCHPEVYGAGELDLFYNLAMSSHYGNPDLTKAIRETDAKAQDFKEIGEQYCKTLNKLAPESRFITDKLPHNFLHIGIIKLALPKAKIIHCRRSPEDCCLSLFKTYFPTNAMGFSYNLTELGEYHLLYQELMEYWHTIMPGHIFDVNYEDMIADQKTTTRGLLDYCGLEWDDACLDFHKSKRPVKTASVGQVRQPIYKSSVQRWKRYEKQLRPLLKILHPTV